MEQDLLHPKEVADKLAVSLSTVWRLIRSGQLPTVAVGFSSECRRKRVRPADLEEFIKARRNAA